MTSLEKPEIVTTNVRWRWPSVHPEGRKFVVISGVVALAFLLFIWDELGFALLGLTIWVAAFFRDPIRTTPKGEG
jgi:phosphatidylserine decarboxylase